VNLWTYFGGYHLWHILEYVQHWQELIYNEVILSLLNSRMQMITPSTQALQQFGCVELAIQNCYSSAAALAAHG